MSLRCPRLTLQRPISQTQMENPPAFFYNEPPERRQTGSFVFSSENLGGATSKSMERACCIWAVQTRRRSRLLCAHAPHQARPVHKVAALCVGRGKRRDADLLSN
jgi:hypothetical protein